MELRGADVPVRDFPDLRRGHHQLVGQGSAEIDRYALVNIETDRVTNSLNTLSEQVRAWRRLNRQNA